MHTSPAVAYLNYHCIVSGLRCLLLLGIWAGVIILGIEMKPKLILCLALVLSGGLFGCATKPDAIDLFVANLSAENGMWENGMDAIRVTQATTPEEVVSETFRMAEFERGRVTNYQILKIRKVHIDYSPDTYTAVLVDTNLGRMIVLMEYIQVKGTTPGHWWRRIYSAFPAIERLY
jgi:hypothetical protein